MKKVAVVCALPPERNTGMATVDLAAFSIVPSLAPDIEVTFYSYGKVSEYSYQPGELPFHYVDILEDVDSYLASDVIIFWGDFIHSRSYWEKDRGAWDKSSSSAQLSELRQNYAKYIFLSSLSVEELRKAIIVGSTIITNSASDSLDEFYKSHSERLFEHAGAVLFRDALSAAKVSPFRGLNASLACDCALLLEDRHLASLTGFQPAASRKGVGVYFGRTKSKLPMLLFSRLLSKRLGEECRWIPWLQTRRRWRLAAKVFGYNVAPGDTDPGTLLSQLSGFRFIVTDTYHLCVNAWRMGIPAICIGKGAGVSEHSLADKKKEILYEMYGARDFYVFAENLHRMNGFSKALDHAERSLKDTALVAEVTSTIRHHVGTAMLRLKTALERALQ